MSFLMDSFAANSSVVIGLRMKSAPSDWLRAGVVSVEQGGPVKHSHWVSGERMDTAPVTRRVVGLGDERTMDR